VDKRGSGVVILSADFMCGGSSGLDLLGIFTWFPQVRHPALTWAWSAAMSLAMSPHFHGVYVNNLGQEGGSRVRDAYGINYDHLASIKAAYDPDNLFRLNQNIQPQLTCPRGAGVRR